MTWTPTKLRFWHHAIIDWMLANPDGTMKRCADELGRGYQSVLMVTNSDMFKAEFLRRRKQIDDSLTEALNGNLLRIATAGTDRIAEELESKSKILPLSEVTDVTMKTLEKLGYGAKPASVAGGSVEVNITTPISHGTLQDAKGILREVEEHRRLNPPPKQIEGTTNGASGSFHHTCEPAEAQTPEALPRSERSEEGKPPPCVPGPVEKRKSLGLDPLGESGQTL